MISGTVGQYMALSIQRLVLAFLCVSLGNRENDDGILIGNAVWGAGRTA